MLVIIRLFFALLALLIGWTAVVTAAACVFWLAWWYMQGLVFLGFSVPYAPNPSSFLLSLSFTSLALTLLVLIVHLFSPLALMVKSLLRDQPYYRVDSTNQIYNLVEAVSTQENVKTPKVYVYSSGIPGAFCLSGAFSSAIIVSDSLCNTLNIGELSWVIAHEISHITHKDSLVNAFWISINRVLKLAKSGQIFFTDSVSKFLFTMHTPEIVVHLITIPFILIFFVGRWIEILSRFVFILIDRVFSRWTEYRCDREASLITPANYGVSALSKLMSGVEPGFDLFASHPATRDRINHIKYFELSNREARNNI